MIIFLSQKRFCSIEAMFCIPANYSKFNPPLNPPGNPPSEVLSFFFSIFQILFQGANRAGQFWDLEDRRPRLHNRDQRVLHREVAWPEAPSEHESDKEALQRLRAGNLDGQGVTKKVPFLIHLQMVQNPCRFFVLYEKKLFGNSLWIQII